MAGGAAFVPVCIVIDISNLLLVCGHQAILLCSALHEALAELSRFFEGVIDRTAIDIVEVAISGLMQFKPGGLPFAVGDGGCNPASKAAACAHPCAAVHGALVRQQ